jgi:hypothetical protein
MYIFFSYLMPRMAARKENQVLLGIVVVLFVAVLAGVGI